jgi:DNA adenine methylase
MFDLEPRLRPVLKWAGGKRALLPQLIPLFPIRFERYVEPFVGGGAVFLALRDGIPAVINDFNPELVTLYEVLRDDPHGLMASLDALAQRYSEAFYYELRARSEDAKVAKAARTVFLNKTGFNGLYRQNTKGGFNVPFGKRLTCPALYERENLLGVSRHLGGSLVTNRDFEDVLADCGAGDFVYCDPPYEPLSSTSSFNAYKAGGFTQVDQRRLREACLGAVKRGAKVALSNSSAPFITALYAADDVNMIRARRAINSKGAGRGEVDEVLVRMG